jgi:hypothetical protein
LDVKDRISRVSLREGGLFLGKGHNLSTLADGGKELLRIETKIVLGQRRWCYHRNLYLRGEHLFELSRNDKQQRCSILLIIGKKTQAAPK